MGSDRQAQMQQVAREVEELRTSPLYEFRQQKNYKPVVGEGSLQAQVLFIGEAPGASEARSGRPFVGASGRVLDELLESIGLQRQDVYITNVVKDRPPDNRDPHVDEIALYTPFLVQQIAIIQPQVIATLGRFAMEFIFDLLSMPQLGGKISDLHGQVLPAQAPYGPVKVVPLYHPAVALYAREQRETLEKDFQTLKSVLQA